MDRVAIVVVNYGSSALLERNLARVADHSPEIRVYVVDNPTSSAERDRAQAICHARGWTFLPQSGNLGFGGGVNAGAAAALAAGAEDLLLLNPDAFIARADLEMLHRASSDRNLVAAPRITTVDGRPWFSGARVDLATGDMRGPSHSRGEYDVDWVTGACMWITREAWQATGSFDEEYFLYWEDVDYSVRAKAAGMRVQMIEDAVAVHDEGATHREDGSGTRAKSATYYYFNIRNRMMFAGKNVSPSQAHLWRRRDIRSAWKVLLRGGRRQFLQSMTAAISGFRGVRDGRRILRAAQSRHRDGS